MGKKPISYFAVHGHHGFYASFMFDRHNFSILKFIEYAEAQYKSKDAFEQAKARKGPPRCWFSVNAKAYFMGCNTSQGMADTFAKTVLRKGASSYGTKDLTKPGMGSYSLDNGKTWEKSTKGIWQAKYRQGFKGGL